MSAADGRGPWREPRPVIEIEVVPIERITGEGDGVPVLERGMVAISTPELHRMMITADKAAELAEGLLRAVRDCDRIEHARKATP